jgi:hypothetical protein
MVQVLVLAAHAVQPTGVAALRTAPTTASVPTVQAVLMVSLDVLLPPAAPAVHSVVLVVHATQVLVLAWLFST